MQHPSRSYMYSRARSFRFQHAASRARTDRARDPRERRRARASVRGRRSRRRWLAVSIDMQLVPDGVDLDRSPLLGGDAGSQQQTRHGPLRSFAAMSAAFSLTHGCVTALIPLASLEFGEGLGATSLAVLYVVYTLTAMVGATLLVETTGPKWGLVAGLAVFCVYVLSFLLAATVPTFAIAAGLGGAAIGGVGGGVIWTAQGTYFSICSERYAATSGKSHSQATGWLGSAFASCYLGAEITLKLLSSLLMFWPCREQWQGNLVTGHCPSSAVDHSRALGLVFATYGAVSLVATGTMTCVADVRGTGRSVPGVRPATHWSDKSLLALRLMQNDVRVLLLSMLNFAFGFSSAFINTAVTGIIIPHSLGADKVGYLVSIIPLTAALTAVPIAALTERIGSKAPAMVLGGSAFACFYLPFFFSAVSLTDEECLPQDGGSEGDGVTGLTCAEQALSVTFGRWSVLVPLLILNGVGRAVWCVAFPKACRCFLLVGPIAYFDV